MRKNKNITIPITLAEMLTADQKDMKAGKDYKEINKLGKALLKVLLEAKKAQK